MECYYDQAFIAVRDRAGRVVAPGHDAAGRPGGARAIAATPARSRPTAASRLIYDYDYVDPAPLARMSGKLTRYGDVAAPAPGRRRPVLRGRTRRRGPARVRRRRACRRLPPGWTRSYVLRSFGYCKDADPFTATSDTVEPLALARHARVPVRVRSRPPDDPGPRGLSARVSDPAGGRGSRPVDSIDDFPSRGGQEWITSRTALLGFPSLFSRLDQPRCPTRLVRDVSEA